MSMDTGKICSPSLRSVQTNEYNKYLDLFVSRARRNVFVASVSGRYYAMDRDKREERIDKALRCVYEDEGKEGALCQRSFVEQIRGHVSMRYSEGETDEFIEPFRAKGAPCIRKGEPVIITNFRVDRVNQIYRRLVKTNKVVSMTRIAPEQNDEEVLFERPEIRNTLPEVVANSCLKQARIAETEKFAHVTFFFNGGRTKLFSGEEQFLVPSLRVETYDLAPHMSADAVTEKIKEAMDAETHLIVANFANPDMVGHTGKFEETVRAVKKVDESIGVVYRYARKCGYDLVITADHGNAEVMEDSGGVVKAHTRNRVPLIICPSEDNGQARAKHCGRGGEGEEPVLEDREEHSYNWGFTETSGTLADVAPTVLELLGLNKPEDMDGHSLLEKVRWPK
jgi:2,3-bisphosphoglycerate-independent phosphoglycerate mutase